MATSKPRSRSTPGFHKSSDISVRKNRRRTSTVSKRLEKKSSLSTTVSSSGSEANAKLSEDSAKSSCIYKPISPSGSSGLDAQNRKTGRRKLKKKVISKNRNAKLQLVNAENPGLCYSTEIESRVDGTINLDESIENVFNETLRWSNVCSDSEEEDERLRIYKENRRRRYVEAMHVKVAKRMSEFSQK